MANSEDHSGFLEKTQEIYDYCELTVHPSLKKNEAIEAAWTEFNRPQFTQKLEHPQLFNDPIHGSIELNALEQAIIHTPEFFRLQDIKQLGVTSFVYPGATHTRFEHSIGVCYIAGQFVDHLKEDIKKAEKELTDLNFTKEDGICIRIAALCHDLGHGPLSHLFESMANEIKTEKGELNHQDLSKLIFKKILLDRPVVLANFFQFGLNLEHLIKIEDMMGTGEKKVIPKQERFMYEIVANHILSGMDVDKWDYIARDCHYLGIGNDFDWRRLMTLSRIIEVKKDELNDDVISTSKHCDGYHIGFREKEALDILRMYQTRCTLHQKVYQHPVKNGIELLVKDALMSVKDLKLIGGIPKSEVSPKTMTTETNGTFTAISIQDAVNMVLEKPAWLTGYVALSDGLLKEIRHLPGMEEKTEKAQNLITRLENRDHYKHKSELEVSITFGDEYDTYQFEGTENSFKESLKELNMKAFCKGLLKEKGDLNFKPEELFEIQIVPITFASEANPDPLGDIFFYKKGANSRKEVILMSDKISDVNKPKAYMEYRFRFYSKVTDEEQVDTMKSIQDYFKIWSEDCSLKLQEKFKKPNRKRSCNEIRDGFCSDASSSSKKLPKLQ